MEIFQLAASVGGIGGLMAVIIFYIYRQDRNKTFSLMREDRTFMEDRLTRLIEADQESREHISMALTELTTLISRLNGKLKEKE